MRQVFIDVGANIGEISRNFAAENPRHEIYCIEPNRDLIHHITNSGFMCHRTFITMWAAAWTYDGYIDLFQSDRNAASTVVAGKVETNGWPPIDYANPNSVPCFDFSAWLLRHFTLSDDVTIKMDIEGAEYDVLEKMIADRSLLLARRLLVEWHRDRYPDFPPERHDALVSQLRTMTRLEEWG